MSMLDQTPQPLTDPGDSNNNKNSYCICPSWCQNYTPRIFISPIIFIIGFSLLIVGLVVTDNNSNNYISLGLSLIGTSILGMMFIIYRLYIKRNNNNANYVANRMIIVIFFKNIFSWIL